MGQNFCTMQLLPHIPMNCLHASEMKFLGNERSLTGKETFIRSSVTVNKADETIYGFCIIIKTVSEPWFVVLWQPSFSSNEIKTCMT